MDDTTHKLVRDSAQGKDSIQLVAPVAIQDRSTSKAHWSIHRFTSDVFDGQVQPYFIERSDYLTIAMQALRNGFHAVFMEYYTKAMQLAERGEQYAYGISQIPGNLTLNEGLNLVTTLVCGGTGTPWNNTNAYIGVGDSTTIEDVAQTGLLAPTNKLYVAVSQGYPIFGTSQQATWQAVFGPSQANYGWNEFTLANGNSNSAANLNRKVSAQGTKQSGQTWVLTLTVVWS
jgi:hypothetical protein